MKIKVETQALTSEELTAIKVALEFVIDEKLQLDLENYDRARRKVDDVLDKYCRPPHYNVFALLPLLANNDEE